jgi:hypothetical protein
LPTVIPTNLLTFFATFIISTYAGNGVEGYSDNGLATNAAIRYAAGLTTDTNGNLYVADTFNHAIRKINKKTNIMTTVAGTVIMVTIFKQQVQG